MRDWWADAGGQGMHPADAEYLENHPNLPNLRRYYVNWNLQGALEHATNLPPARTLHVGLYSQPYLGNIITPTICILHGNPGFDFRDYYDEFVNTQHAAMCARNLRDDTNGFFSLHKHAPASGAQYYWLTAFRRTTKAIAVSRKITEVAARALLCEHVGLIESCAYHSISTPGARTDNLPSSVRAREYAQRMFQRARRNETLVIVWRRGAAYWGVGAEHANILVRTHHQAQSRYLLPGETERIVEFLRGAVPL